MHTDCSKDTGEEGQGSRRVLHCDSHSLQTKGGEQSPYSHSACHCICPAVHIREEGREGEREEGGRKRGGSERGEGRGGRGENA